MKSYLYKVWNLLKKFEKFDTKYQNHGKDNFIAFELAKSNVYKHLNRFDTMTQYLDKYKNRINSKGEKTCALFNENECIQYGKRLHLKNV